jgi:hypothetical protein
MRNIKFYLTVTCLVFLTSCQDMISEAELNNVGVTYEDQGPLNSTQTGYTKSIKELLSPQNQNYKFELIYQSVTDFFGDSTMILSDCIFAPTDPTSPLWNSDVQDTRAFIGTYGALEVNGQAKGDTVTDINIFFSFDFNDSVEVALAKDFMPSFTANYLSHMHKIDNNRYYGYELDVLKSDITHDLVNGTDYRILYRDLHRKDLLVGAVLQAAGWLTDEVYVINFLTPYGFVLWEDYLLGKIVFPVDQIRIKVQRQLK